MQSRRLRRYQVYLVLPSYPYGKYLGFREGWDLTAEGAVAELCDGIRRRVRGNRFESVDGAILFAELVR